MARGFLEQSLEYRLNRAGHTGDTKKVLAPSHRTHTRVSGPYTASPRDATIPHQARQALWGTPGPYRPISHRHHEKRDAYVPRSGVEYRAAQMPERNFLLLRYQQWLAPALLEYPTLTSI